MSTPAVSSGSASSQIQVLPVTADDAPVASGIVEDAFAEDAVSQLIWGQCDPAASRAASVAKLRQSLNAPYRSFRKAVRNSGDDGDDEIIAASFSSEVDASRTQQVEDPADPTPGTNLELRDAWFGMLGGLFESYKRDDPKFYHLTVLVVSPMAQRSGAGTALLKAFLEDADREDLPCYLESSVKGEWLYRRHGFVQCRERAHCGPDGVMNVLPMRRPAKSDRSANGVSVTRAFNHDARPLAQVHRRSFAEEPWMKYIWGQVDDEAHCRRMAKYFSSDLGNIRRADLPGFRTPVGLSHAYVVDVGQERDKPAPTFAAGDDHEPGTDVELLKEFMALLADVRSKFRERDSRFMHVRILAVEPNAQRRGVGRALLEPILAEADRQGLPTYLEASEVGAKLYKKVGFVACGNLASCASNSAVSVLPMRRPAKAEKGVSIIRATEQDAVPLAHLHRRAFAEEPWMRCIWAQVPDEAYVCRTAKHFATDCADIRKAELPGFSTPVGMSHYVTVDATKEREKPTSTAASAAKGNDDFEPGTNAELMKEVDAVLTEVRATFRERDSRFIHVRTFAVDADAQRRGVGKALLEDILAEADLQDLPVYLESSKVGTKLYRNHGFVACGPLATAASNPAVSGLPMRRPAKSEVQSGNMVISPAEEDDMLTLAKVHNLAFADDAFMPLIWGKVDPEEHARRLSEWFKTEKLKIRKAVAREFAKPVGMTLAYEVDVEKERGKEAPPQQADDEHQPGTDLKLYKEFMGMLARVRAKYRERDDHFIHLEILAIDPAAQRRGYGKALLEAVLADADRQNLPVYLEASAVGTSLYRKHGFVECAEPASCGPDGVISVLPMRRPPPKDLS